MAREKSLDPLHAWRRKEREKALKEKKRARDEKLSEIPAHRRDPAPLVSEIYRLSVLEYEGRLNSDLKQHKKRLMDQYQSIKKARTTAGIETIELVEFDPEAYEESKLKQLHQKRTKIDVPIISPKSQISSSAGLDDRGLPKLPDAPCPTENDLFSFGLPAYSPFPFVADDEEDTIESVNSEINTHDNDFEHENFDELEAQLEAEYELFKESIENNDE